MHARWPTPSFMLRVLAAGLLGLLLMAAGTARAAADGNEALDALITWAE